MLQSFSGSQQPTETSLPHRALHYQFPKWPARDRACHSLWNSSTLLRGFWLKDHHSERKLNFKKFPVLQNFFQPSLHWIEFRIRNPVLQHKYWPHGHKNCRHMWLLTSMRRLFLKKNLAMVLSRWQLIFWPCLSRTQFFYESHENGFQLYKELFINNAWVLLKSSSVWSSVFWSSSSFFWRFVKFWLIRELSPPSPKISSCLVAALEAVMSLWCSHVQSPHCLIAATHWPWTNTQRAEAEALSRWVWHL